MAGLLTAHLHLALGWGWVKLFRPNWVTDSWYAPASLGLSPLQEKRDILPVPPPQKAREGTRSKEAVAYVLWEPGDGHRACVTSFKP